MIRRVLLSVAQMRTVTTGQRDSVAAEILSGLQKGDQVILHPPDTVKHGTRVRTRA